MQKTCLTVVSAGLCAAAWGARLTSQSYVQDGLVAHFDAIENVGVGQHEASPTVWKDLKGNASIAIPSGVAWIDRGLDANRVGLTMANMPAFHLRSVSTELVMDRIGNGPAGNFPRPFQHTGSDGTYSIYFHGASTSPILFIGDSGTRLSFGNLTSGTLGITSDKTGFRTYQGGVMQGSSGSEVATNKEAAACSWYMNLQYGYLEANYRAFRHYNRALTLDELARDAQIDDFRFYSYSVTGTDAETAIAWPSVNWQVPYGRTGVCPSALTNDTAQIIGAKVSVAVEDGVMLKALSLEDGATLDLSSGATVHARSLWVECEPLSRGFYTGVEGTYATKVSWITGSGVVCVAGEGNSKFPVHTVCLGPGSYVQDGLVTQFDAIDNAGKGAHDPAATVWCDLVRSASLTLTTNTTWQDGRYFFKGGDGRPVEIKSMPGYVRNSLTCEVPVNIRESASSASDGNYPRIFSHYESLSIYFAYSDPTALVYMNGQTPDTRPNLGTFRTGTATVLSGATGYGGAVNGVVKSMTGVPVKNGLVIGAGPWSLGYAGRIIAAYGGLRFYNRRLTDDEVAWNASIDLLRFFSYAYANEGEEIAWADIPWNKPEGQTAAAPIAATNQCVSITRAQVGVAATDALALMGIALEDGARLKIADDTVIAAKFIFVNGKAVEHGIFTGEGGTTGTVVDWISGKGQVRVAGGIRRGIPSSVPVADDEGWYTFGLLNGNCDQRWIVGEHPVWDDYAFPAGAKLRLRGWLLLDTVPDIFADYDTTQLKRVFVNGTRPYAADRPFEVPKGATFRYAPGSWKSSAGNTNTVATLDAALMAEATGDVELGEGANFHIQGDGLPNLTYGGLLSGTGVLAINSYGRQMHFTGGFACDAEGGTGWQNGSGVWIDTLAVTSSLKTVTLSGCGDSHGMTAAYSASYVMFGKDNSGETADNPLHIARLNGNASSRVDSAGRRWRSGGHVLVWGSNTVHVGALHAGLHVVADRGDQDCDNGFLNTGSGWKSKGTGNLVVDAFNTGTIYASTNIALTIGTVAANTAIDYTYQSNAVNRMTLDITNGCAAATTLKATDLAMLPARVSGFKGNVSLTDTEERSYEIPLDLTAGPDALYNTVGCDGSGTLVAAPARGTINVTFPTAGIVPGKYAIAKFSAGGELLKGWTVTLNGENVRCKTVDGHCLTLRQNAKGIWLGVDLPGCIVILK